MSIMVCIDIKNSVRCSYESLMMLVLIWLMCIISIYCYLLKG